MTPFLNAVAQTRRLVRTIKDGDERRHRLELLTRLVTAKRRGKQSLEIVQRRHPHYRDHMDVIILVERCKTRNFAIDSRLAILVAALADEVVLRYILDNVPGVVTAKRGWYTAGRQICRRTRGMVGTWMLDILGITSAQFVLIDQRGRETSGLVFIPWPLHPDHNRFVIPR